MVEIDLIAAYADRFGHAQAVSEHHQDQEMVPDAVPALLHGFEERGDLRRAWRKSLARSWPLVVKGRTARSAERARGRSANLEAWNSWNGRPWRAA